MPNQSTKFQLLSIIGDSEIMEELKDRAHAGRLRNAVEHRVGAESIERYVTLPETLPSPSLEGLTHARELAPTPDFPGDDHVLEAIVIEFGRPSLIVQDGTFAIPESSKWKRQLLLSRSNIEAGIARVGRIEVVNHLNFTWVGTGWLVAPNIVVTNRHVARLFATDDGQGGFRFDRNLLGMELGAKLDLLEEYEREAEHEIAIEKILYIAPVGVANPDIALLQVRSDVPLPDPLPLSTRELFVGQEIGTIGYPAFDSRNGLEAMERYFGGIYDVKRMAPGEVRLVPSDGHFFIHDCTTLGGSSGSEVIALDSGEVVGLHFAGVFGEANYAVHARQIQQALAGISMLVQELPYERSGEEELPEADKTHRPDHFIGRDGYQSDFLGQPEIPLPGLGVWAEDVASVSDAPTETQYVARYRHFSVIMSKSRKLPLVTAVNIDGRQLRRIPRVRKWYLDARIDLEFQTGNELYEHNDLDRGHMVRRLDPVWGDYAEAEEANDDTFHYTNAAPQHKLLNQQDWLDLESLVLDCADAKDIKMSVFGGPILRVNDPIYRDARLPREFWKIILLVNAETDALTAMGFVLSHSHLVRSLEETVLDPGTLVVYQFALSEIASRTGLNFDHLLNADPLSHTEVVEEGTSAMAESRRIRSVEDIVFSA